MIGIDKNVLVRYLVRDDQSQFDRARKLISRKTAAGEKVLIGLLVLLETEWVLRSRYVIPKADIVRAFSALLDATEVFFEDESSLEAAIYTWKDSPAEFADCLIGARNSRLGCSATATFDKRALALGRFVAA
jgi:predicted nucleic-acid-binding protein